MDSFDEFYTAYLDRLFTFCRYRVGSREDAEDLTAESFRKFFQADGLNRDNPAGFLYRIARNSIIDYYRTHKNMSLLSNITMEPETDGGLRQADNRLMVDYVLKSMDSLPPDQKDAVIMRYINDLEYEDIASALGKTQSAARQLVSRGLEHLREVIHV